MFRLALRLLGYLVGSAEELDACLKLMNIQARQLIAMDFWRPAIDAIASDLLARRRLSGRRARRIIRDAVGQRMKGDSR